MHEHYSGTEKQKMLLSVSAWMELEKKMCSRISRHWRQKPQIVTLGTLREAESGRVATTDGRRKKKGGVERRLVSGCKGAPEDEKWPLPFCTFIG